MTPEQIAEKLEAILSDLYSEIKMDSITEEASKLEGELGCASCAENPEALLVNLQEAASVVEDLEDAVKEARKEITRLLRLTTKLVEKKDDEDE
jgi:iron only hydrogenase large subunit-like protein